LAIWAKIVVNRSHERLKRSTEVNDPTVETLESRGLKIYGDTAVGFLRDFPISMKLIPRTHYFRLSLWVHGAAGDHLKTIQEILDGYVAQKTFIKAKEYGTRIVLDSPQCPGGPGSFLEDTETFLQDLEEMRIKGGCTSCREYKSMNIYHTAEGIRPLCDDCLADLKKEKDLLNKKYSPSRYMLGGLGSLLGALLLLFAAPFLSSWGIPYFLLMTGFVLLGTLGYILFQGPETQSGIPLVLVPPVAVFLLGWFFYRPWLRSWAFQDHWLYMRR
jgi:hypothetical protein